MSTIEIDPEPPLCLGPELAGTLMTPEEFDTVGEEDDEYVYELIHGVLVVSPPISEEERKPNELLGHWLLTYAEQHPQGSALNETLPEHRVQTAHSRRRADRVIWAGLGRVPNPRRESPTIVVEFVSAGKRNRQRDYSEKRDEYLAVGIQEYWVIDRFRRAMTVYRAGEPDIIVGQEGVYRTPLLPGFDLALSRLFDAAARWPQ